MLRTDGGYEPVRWISAVGPHNTLSNALSDIGPAARVALPVLRKALEEQDEDVRGWAEEALENLLPFQTTVQ